MTIGQVRMETIDNNYTKMGDDYCPACNRKCDSATAIEGTATPVPGDISVCFNCGEWLEFSNDMALIKMPEKTRSELTKENHELLSDATFNFKKRGPLKD